MSIRSSRRVLSAAALAAIAVLVPAAATAAPPDRTLSPSTRFFVPVPDPGAVKQGLQLALHGDVADAKLLARMVATPQAVWLTGGTPQDVQRTVRRTMLGAAVERAVPVFVAYDLPFRDCGQYSAGGASDTASYLAWIDGVAKGIGNGKAVVLLEPDGLGIIPYNTDINGVQEWCKPDLTGTGLTPAAANQARYDQVSGAVDRLERQPGVAVYLDGVNSAWLGVGDIAQRLVRAGVQRAQGFFENVSNYQYTSNSVAYGTWVSDCIAYATAVAPGDFGSCPNQYWNGGPPNWVGTALSPYGVWSDTASEPDLWTGGLSARYAGMLGSTAPTTRFVVDTSRNGLGPNDMSAYAAAPYGQPGDVVSTLQAGNWCNNPQSGLGPTPTASTGVPLVDAYLWVKTPGQSDGQCDAAGGTRAWDYGQYTQPDWPTDAGQQALFDPLWGLFDPAAGAWFPQLALQLARNAQPPLG